MSQARILVVGAGFAGSVTARVLAEAGCCVTVLDKRPHVGGNAYDTHDEHGVLVHPYGPHIFHTNSDKVFRWLSRFTEWRPYEHRVLASVKGQLLPIPINRTTLNRLYGLNLDEAGAAAYLEKVRVPVDPIKTSEDAVLSSVGPDLCDLFFRGYTRKQWGLELGQLSAGVVARIPTRTNDDDRYFTDTHQCMPKHGYTRMFENILDHPFVRVVTGVDDDGYAKNHREPPLHTVYTGPIDVYFGMRFGPLPYRSIRFEHVHLPDVSQHQPVGTVNYPNDYDFTRITEFKHITGQQTGAGTSIVREYPQDAGDPYYPVPRPENEVLYRRYRQLADALPNVTFVGRLAQYRYYNMDQVVATGMHAARKILASLRV